MHTVFLLLGSNLGDKTTLLYKAGERIAKEIGVITLFSSVYESEPWGFNSNEWFVNQVLQVKTDLAPEKLLYVLQQIEKEMGRVRKQTMSYESRLIDIDILFYDNLILQTPDLVIPHPRLHERRFTLLPLVEIAPEFEHPLLHKNMKSLLEKCNDKGKVQKI